MTKLTGVMIRLLTVLFGLLAGFHPAVMPAVAAAAEAQRSKPSVWDAAIVFLSSPDDTEEYHRDVDVNIAELLMVGTYNWSPRLRLTIYREFNGKWFIYRPDPASKSRHNWDEMFFAPEVIGVDVPGLYRSGKGSTSLLQRPNDLREFFQDAFPDAGAKKLLDDFNLMVSAQEGSSRRSYRNWLGP